MIFILFIGITIVCGIKFISYTLAFIFVIIISFHIDHLFRNQIEITELSFTLKMYEFI